MGKGATLFWVILALFVLGFGFGCGDDDDTADDDDDMVDDDDTADDDDIDDDDDDDTIDDDDDDDTADDDDDDSSPWGPQIQDDGQVDSGFAATCLNCVIAQKYAPLEYPAVIESIEYYVFGDLGRENEVTINVYYDPVKADGTVGQMQFQTLPFTVGPADQWSTVDLSEFQILQDVPVTQGDFWIGFEYQVEIGGGPWIGWDYDGIPDDEMWYYSTTDAQWIALAEHGYTGVLMVRPSLAPYSTTKD